MILPGSVVVGLVVWLMLVRSGPFGSFDLIYTRQAMVLAQAGKVTLHTTKYPLDAINDAMADLDNGRLQGRGILVPA